jgi:hypothetical protein
MSSGKNQSNTIKNAIASQHRSPDFCLPPTAIQTKPVINDKNQQTMEPVEMDFSMTAQIREMDFSTSQIPQMDISEYRTMKQMEMDFSEYNTKKRVEMDFTMTTQEPVEWV